MSTRLGERGRHIGRLLIEAQRRFNEGLIARLHDRGYTDIRAAHGAVFANIDAQGARASELARRADMTKQAMAELIDDLEAKGYVERRPDPLDGRAHIVVLTQRGRRVDRVAAAVIGELERGYERLLGQDGLLKLKEGLERLLDAR